MNKTCKNCVYFAQSSSPLSASFGLGECLLSHGAPKKEDSCACKYYKQTPNDSEE